LLSGCACPFTAITEACGKDLAAQKELLALLAKWWKP
jgi:hypothetical protein